ncbi:unnamed protein product, partial [marine sediment metagenome]
YAQKKKNLININRIIGFTPEATIPIRKKNT